MTAIVNIIKDRKVYLGGVDLSGDENEVSLTLEFDMKECTTFPDSAHVNAPGLSKVTLNQKGFVSFGEGLVDETLVARLGKAGVPVSVTQKGGLAGEIAYFTKAWGSSYAPRMAVGELPSFDFNMAQAGGAVIRGTILMVKATLANGAHQGTAFNLGAVPEGSKMYAALHVFDGSASGSIQIDGTDKITFEQTAGPGSLYKVVDGPIAGAQWRAVITAVGPSTVFVVAGIA